MHGLDRNTLTRDFLQLIRTVPDNKKGIYPTIDFLGMLLRLGHLSPPYMEYVTLLKYKKPMLFHHLKHALSSTSPLQHVISLQMDREQALARLGLTEQDLTSLNASETLE